MKTIKLTTLILLISLICSCGDDDITTDDGGKNTENTGNTSDYTGTASVTQGTGTATVSNLYEKGQRVSPVGTITASDNSTWTVPADVNYTNTDFPFAPDLSNPDGVSYKSAKEALAAFDDKYIVEVDADGEVITAFVFADNYFEMYINGTPIGKDAIPFTSFNSHIMKFKVSTPFTIAMLLVDWEENLGLGSEANGNSQYHPGDGGLVAVFTDVSGKIVATTSESWKAQTFYTSPISDLTCPTESGTTRSSSACSTEDVDDGSEFYALHWEIPSDWMNEDFDDSDWPDATTYTNETIGVDNKRSYTDFTDIFDDSNDDASFIWSTNVVLDNEVIVRYTVN